VLLAFGDGRKPMVSPQDVPLVGVYITADKPNRLTASANATPLTNDGAGHQFKLDKAAAGCAGSFVSRPAPRRSCPRH
jgi:hypothetical protein